jgi:hypothetical protein
MTGVLYAQVSGSVGSYTMNSASITVVVADAATAQAALNAIKGWFQAAGMSNLSVTGTFNPQSSELTA